MKTYVARRLLLMLPTLLGITIVTFALCQFVPGGPIDQMKLRLAGGAGGEGGAGGGGRTQLAIPEAQYEKLKKFYGFDQPVPVRYVKYLRQLVTGEFGSSFRYTRPVTELIAERIPVSAFFGAISFFMTYGICIPLGVLKALRHRTLLDTGTSVAIFAGYALPSYALGAVLLVVLSVRYDLFPLAGFTSEGFAGMSLAGKVKDLAHHAALPVVCYMVGQFAFLTMLMKNSLMENMSADYVKTALAKGLSSQRAVFVHAFRNSLIPLATSFGNNISFFLVGSLFIERVFQIPGMGLLNFEAIQSRDYPIVMAIIVIGSATALVGNLLSDMCVAAVDPRVKFG